MEVEKAVEYRVRIMELLKEYFSDYEELIGCSQDVFEMVGLPKVFIEKPKGDAPAIK